MHTLWLKDEVERHGPQIGRHLLVVQTLDLIKTMSFLRDRIENQLSGENWTELGTKSRGSASGKWRTCRLKANSRRSSPSTAAVPAYFLTRSTPFFALDYGVSVSIGQSCQHLSHSKT